VKEVQEREATIRQQAAFIARERNWDAKEKEMVAYRLVDLVGRASAATPAKKRSGLVGDIEALPMPSRPIPGPR
jgi:hypothetical protein